MVLICHGISSQAQNDSIAEIDKIIKDNNSQICSNDCIYLQGNLSNDTNYINTWYFYHVSTGNVELNDANSCASLDAQRIGNGSFIYEATHKSTQVTTRDTMGFSIVQSPSFFFGDYTLSIDEPSIVISDEALFQNPGTGTFDGPGVIDYYTGEFDPSIAGVGVHEVIYTDNGICYQSDTIFITVLDTTQQECSKQLASYEFYGDFRIGTASCAKFKFVNLSANTMKDVEAYVIWDSFIPISNTIITNGILNSSYGDSLLLTADSLQSGEELKLTILYTSPVDVNEIGRGICFKSNVWNSCYELSDMDTNLRGYCSPLRAPYDPNHKEATINDGPMDASTTQLTYEIQFQNLGNDTAFTVVIEDTINPSHFDINSITMIGSSDPYTMTKVVNSNLVRWEFKDIKLVDSLTNEPESHGSLRFSIDLKSGIQIGEKVNNTAHIYFDHNPVIATNTAENYFVAPISTNMIRTVSNLKAYPVNAGEIQVELNALNNNEGFYSLTEIGGKVFSQQKLLIHKGKNNFQITTGKLAAGIYILKINEVSTQIMIK